MQTLLTRWFCDNANANANTNATERRGKRPAQVAGAPKRAVALFDDGTALQAWETRGYKTARTPPSLAPEAHHSGSSARDFLAPYADDLAIAVAFPACTDLSAAGARWWKDKRKKNPNFQDHAVARIRSVEAAMRATGVPYAMIVPASPRLRMMWKSPDAIISPHEYGGWLPADAPHPLFPDVVPAQDAYKKRTYVYFGNGFVLPRRRPVIPKWTTRQRKGKTVRVSPLLVRRKHRHVRRLTPLGFLEAVAERNSRNCD